MSRLEELIQKLCPNGVEYIPLCECTFLRAGDRITTAMMDDSYEYPVMGGGTNPTGKYSNYNFENSITISRAGSAGYVNWMEEKFWATDVCFVASQKLENTLIKFIYYYVKNMQSELQKKTYGGNLPKLNKDYLWQLPIPIPPIEVQSEIVRILDNFTLLTAELTAELTAKKQQYVYYRDLLLSFYNEVEYFTLEEISNGIFSGKNKERNENGIFPIYGSTGIIGKTNIWIYEQEQILIARVGANAGFIHIANGKYDVSDNTLILDVKKDFSLKYIYYLLEKENLHKYAKGGGQPLVTAGELKKIKIPVPSLEEQQRIVDILDKFDAYCNDLTQGLPAEIELRKQQYEYYRNKLLTFEELK